LKREQGLRRVSGAEQKSTMALVDHRRQSLVHLIKEQGKSVKSIKNLDPKIEYCLQDLLPMWEESSIVASTPASAPASTPSMILGTSYQRVPDESKRELTVDGTFRDSITSTFESTRFDPSSWLDIDAQRKELEFFEQEKRASEQDRVFAAQLSEKEVQYDEDEDEIIPGELQGEMIDVSPGVSLPLRSSIEIWQAIMHGNVVVTTCYSCSSNLTSIADAELVICADCWVFIPVNQLPSGNCLEGDRKSGGVCVGVEPEEIVQWMNCHGF
jgi:hypothetical protein